MRTLFVLLGAIVLSGCVASQLSYPRPDLQIVRSANTEQQLVRKIGDPTLKYQSGERALYIYVINDLSTTPTSNERALIYAFINDGLIRSSGERFTSDNSEIKALRNQFYFAESHLISPKS